MRKLTRAFAPIVFVLSLLLSGCALPMPSSSMVSMDELPAYSDSAYVEIDGNQPYFTDADKQETEAFEEYSDLDYLGRCGTAYANVGQELMPADGEKRGSIGQVKPTGWHTVKYDCVDGKYLYNRCHLIGWQLTAENANKQNLITGTRYLNIEGMLPFENMVADYVKETGNHVLYRVTPVFGGSNLVARWRRGRSRMTAKAFALTCTAITSNRAWKLIMPPAKVRQRKEKTASSVGLAVFLSLRMEN